MYYSAKNSSIKDLSNEDIVIEFVYQVPRDPYTIVTQHKYSEVILNKEETLEAVFMGPHISCPRCGKELKPYYVDNPTLIIEWGIYYNISNHTAPCGLSCLPKGISYVGFEEGIHFGNDKCNKCSNN